MLDDLLPPRPSQPNIGSNDSDDDEDDLANFEIAEEDVFVDLTLPRAQIFKNFLDRIRHQNSDLPLLFKRDGLYIQSMEPGKQACELKEKRNTIDTMFH